MLGKIFSFAAISYSLYLGYSIYTAPNVCGKFEAAVTPLIQFTRGVEKIGLSQNSAEWRVFFNKAGSYFWGQEINSCQLVQEIRKEEREIVLDEAKNIDRESARKYLEAATED